jgi:hypothetical protein
MKIIGVSMAAGVLAAALSQSSAASGQTGAAASEPAEPRGLHDFDFLIGEWRVHHHRLKERLAGNHEWVEFGGTSSARKIMGAQGNMDDNVLDLPGGAYRAVTLRAFDPKTRLWAIWWLDGRDPSAALDPPVKGRFEHGVGTFYADIVFEGKPVRVRFVWSHITTDSARWEQAFSPDAGGSWETNWIMEFQRVPWLALAANPLI